MLRKISITLILLLTLASCQSTKKDSGSRNDSNFAIEDQVVEEGNYKTIDNEQQALTLNEKEQSLNEVVPAEVEVKDRIFFGYDSANISNEAGEILDTQISWLESNPDIKITIEGHCDERGTREYNIALGEKRAVAAKNYLEKGGISADRIKVISFGKERPAYFGTSEDVYAKNRRAVVIVN